jgi:uncharacterized protein (TIGR04255 family)
MQFLKEDDSALVQVWPNTLAITRLRPYGSWASYKEEILGQLRVYQKVSGQTSFTRIGLRYINRLELPYRQPQGAALGAYLVSIPTVAPTIPQTYTSLLMQLDIPYEESPPMSLRLVVGTLPPEVGETLPVMLDLDMSTQADLIPSIESVPDWLDAAHRRLEQAFESSLTDKTHKELLQEIA